MLINNHHRWLQNCRCWHDHNYGLARGLSIGANQIAADNHASRLERKMGSLVGSKISLIIFCNKNKYIK